MTISAVLYTPTGTESPQDFYNTAAGNLKTKYAPKLRILHVYGGHTFYPENSVGICLITSLMSFVFQSAKVIQEEIVYTKNNLNALLKALNQNKITVSSTLITIMLVVDDKVGIFKRDLNDCCCYRVRKRANSKTSSPNNSERTPLSMTVMKTVWSCCSRWKERTFISI